MAESTCMARCSSDITTSSADEEVVREWFQPCAIYLERICIKCPVVANSLQRVIRPASLLTCTPILTCNPFLGCHRHVRRIPVHAEKLMQVDRSRRYLSPGLPSPDSGA